MKSLIRVVRSGYTPEFVPDNQNTAGHWRRRLPSAILPGREIREREVVNYAKEADFFLVEAEDVEIALRTFAECNPGCAVEAYSLEASAQCPAAPMVLKKVSKDGVLPG